MIWTPNQIIGCRFENSPNNANGDVFTEAGGLVYETGVMGMQANLASSNARILLGTNYIGHKMQGKRYFAICKWYTPTTITVGNGEIISGGINDSGATRITHFISNVNGQLRFGSRSQASDGIDSRLAINFSFQIGVPVHIAVLGDYQDKTIQLFLNGQLNQTETNLSWGSDFYDHSDYSTGSDAIGIRGWTLTNGNHGKTDELNMYSTYLPPSDIKRIYHGLHPLNG